MDYTTGSEIKENFAFSLSVAYNTFSIEEGHLIDFSSQKKSYDQWLIKSIKVQPPGKTKI